MLVKKIIKILMPSLVFLFLSYSSALAQVTPTLTFTADRLEISYGQNINLSWSSTNADSCTGYIGWSGSKGTSGNSTTLALFENTTFVLSCRGVGGEVVKSLSVIVIGGPESSETIYQEQNVTTPSSKVYNPPPKFIKSVVVEIPPPRIVFLANPIVISGSSTELVWSTSNAQSCDASGAWTGPKELSGMENTGPVIADKTYTLHCKGKGGESTKTINIIVKKEDTLIDSFIDQINRILNFIFEKISNLF